MAFDVITPAQLGRGSVTSVIATFYTVQSLERVIVKTIDICNTNITPVTATVYLVPAGGAASDATTLVPGVTLTPKKMFQWSGAQVLNTGDTIQAVSSVSGVTVNISGGNCT